MRSLALIRLFCLMVICLLLDAGSVRAQPAGLTVEKRSGFDGYYRPGAWVPIFVTLTNQPAAGQSFTDLTEFEGQLVLIAGPDGDQTPVRFAREVQVPPSSKKQYTVYAKLPGNLPTMPELLLTGANGKREASFPLDDLNALDPLSIMVVMVSDSLSRPSLPQIRGGLDKVLYAKTPPSQLPDHWAAWDSADVVVLDGWPATGMSMEAAQALRDWVAMGGTLTILGGQSAGTYTDPLAKDLLPVELQGTAYLQEAEGGFKVVRDAPPQEARSPAYVVALNAPRSGTETLLTIDGVPMVVSQRVGKGRIVFLANDFRSASLTLERAFFPAWQAVVPMVNAAGPWHEFHDSLRSFKSLTGRAAKPPNNLLIILICVLYMVSVGPLNFGILSRKKKLEWAWLTVPVIVFGFFFVIYGFGRLSKGNAHLYYELSLEEFAPSAPQGAAFTVGSAFVSSGGNFLVRPSEPRHVLADPFRWNDPFGFRDRTLMNALALGGAAVTGSAIPLSGNPPLVVYDTEKEQVYLRSWNMSTFDARNFVGGGPATVEGSVVNDLRLSASGLSGSVTNRTDRDFDLTWLMVGPDVLPLGPLKAGASARLPDGLRLPRSGASGTLGAGWRSGPEEFGSKVVSVAADANGAADNNFGLAMQSLLAPHLTGRIFPPDAGRIRFLGYQRSAGEPRVISTIATTERHRAVATLVDLDVARDRGPFELPPSQAPLTLMDWTKDPSATVEFEEDGSLNLDDAAVTVCAELPYRDPGASILQFRIVSDFTAPQGQEVVAEIYSWEPGRQGWYEVPLDRQIENRSVALPVSGRMFFRLRSRQPANQQNTGYWERTKVRSLGVSLSGIAN